MFTLFLLTFAAFLIIWVIIFFFLRKRTNKTNLFSAVKPIILGVLLLGVITIFIEIFVFKVDSPNWTLLLMLMVIAFTFGIQTYKSKSK